MTTYRGWTYSVRPVHRGFWTFDLLSRAGGVWQRSVGEIHGNERNARASARKSIDAEIQGLN